MGAGVMVREPPMLESLSMTGLGKYGMLTKNLTEGQDEEVRDRVSRKEEHK
jgi:hypothetical protein